MREDEQEGTDDEGGQVRGGRASERVQTRREGKQEGAHKGGRASETAQTRREGEQEDVRRCRECERDSTRRRSEGDSERGQDSEKG